MDYAEILKEKIPRPFIFGPVDFQELDSVEFEFPADYWNEQVVESLLKSPYLPSDQILVHGVQVMIKSGFLRRASSIVKHSRFLRNLRVLPLFPEVV
jgi:hypothetical protein